MLLFLEALLKINKILKYNIYIIYIIMVETFFNEEIVNDKYK